MAEILTQLITATIPETLVYQEAVPNVAQIAIAVDIRSTRRDAMELYGVTGYILALLESLRGDL